MQSPDKRAHQYCIVRIQMRACNPIQKRTSFLPGSSDSIEARMRAALNLTQSPSSASPNAAAHRGGRHRFVQDGEVPVFLAKPRQPRPDEDRSAVEALERSLAVERDARMAAELALHSAEETIRQLRTRLAHAEIAQQEAAAAPPVPEPVQVAVVTTEDKPAPRPRGRPKKIVTVAAEETDEGDSVEWWKPGWRERFRAQKQNEG